MLSLTNRIRNPKRGKESRAGRASWYEYYAGYSSSFVGDALKYAGTKPQARILDPWNGSGTTTEIVSSLGYEALGFDLNPTMVIVAKARLLDHAVEGTLSSILDDLVSTTAKTDVGDSDEPLASWFTPASAVAIRKFERAIQTLLINSRSYRLVSDLTTLEHVSSIAAFYYVAAFRVLRKALRPFRSANPTWIKQPKTAAERISILEQRFHEMLREEVNKMMADLTSPSAISTTACAPTIDRAASACLPIGDCSVDAVISSPPYCTRIDYVNKTGPELAFLGANTAALKKLRHQMIGTPTIDKLTPEQDPAWGKTCVNAMNAIFSHDSYASRSYYWKTYAQYFSGLYQSLIEIDRILKRPGICILVAQDSYYKNVHIDLARMIGEMAHGLGWAPLASADYPSSKTIVGLNSHAIKNGNPQRAIETVLAFRKEYK